MYGGIENEAAFCFTDVRYLFINWQALASMNNVTTELTN